MKNSGEKEERTFVAVNSKYENEDLRMFPCISTVPYRRQSYGTTTDMVSKGEMERNHCR